jgi:hypothetical protein
MNFDPDGRAVFLPPGMSDWLFGPEGRSGQCEPDPRDDALDRCQQAAGGSQDDWTLFCLASRWFTPVDPTRSARCYQHQYSSRTEKENWCYNEFGD